MNTPTTHPTFASVTIHLAGFDPVEVDLLVIDDGPHEGQIDHAHLSRVVERIYRAAGSTWPVDAAYLQPYAGGTPWQMAVYDAAANRSIGVLTVHAGAGA